MRTAVLLCLLMACAGSGRRPWTAEIALEAGIKLGGCAVGDLVPESPGEEIAVVAATGDVYVVRRDGRAWRSEIVHRAAGEMIQVAIGDADPQTPGLEIVAVGKKQGTEDEPGPGAALLIYREGGRWKSETIFEDTALLHAVCVADRGIVVAGYSRRAHVLGRTGAGWTGVRLADLPAAAKSAIALRGDVAIGCQDGSVILVNEEARVLQKAGNSRARLGTDGQRILVAGDDGSLTLLGGTAEVIYREGARLRGAVLADLDPGHPGPEAATAGYLRSVTVLYPGPAGWEAVKVFEDTERLHHLAAGDIDPDRPGLELAACGYSGRLVVVR